MEKVSIGFIGSGRVTAFMIEGLLGKRTPVAISVQDANPAASEALARLHPSVTDCGTDYSAIGNARIVFLALHPQTMQAACASVAPYLGKDTIVVSLAPKAPLSSISGWTGTDKVARYLPNAATTVGKGYNPVAWGRSLTGEDRAAVTAILSPLGDMPEVEEARIEAYAVLSAMGPTYLWPLLDELTESGRRYGLDDAESARLVARMAAACAGMLETPGKDYATRMDMIPLKPMADIESDLRSMFRSKLDAIYAKLTS